MQRAIAARRFVLCSMVVSRHSRYVLYPSQRLCLSSLLQMADASPMTGWHRLAQLQAAVAHMSAACFEL
jgi:hypothetical protein